VGCNTNIRREEEEEEEEELQPLQEAPI